MGDAPAESLGDVVFWGKRDPGSGALLPLAAHCLDVALVFRRLSVLPGVHRSLQAAAGRHLSGTDLDRLAVLAALHDAGKANLGFQERALAPAAGPGRGHVRELAALFADPGLNERFLDAVDADALGCWADGDTLEGLLVAAWSHHGTPFLPGAVAGAELIAATRSWQARDGVDPFAGIREILRWVREAFPGAWEETTSLLPETPRFQHRFAGLVMLADWLGSDPRAFPVAPVSLEERLAADLGVTTELLRQVGLDPDAPRGYAERDLPPGFEARFGFPPRPMQRLVETLDPASPSSRLVILEAETGSGKTEAALHWFLRLFAAGRVDSLYFALPTRVAARELYGRIRTVIGKLFPGSACPAVLLAVPGYAQIDGTPGGSIPPPDPPADPWTVDGCGIDLAAFRAWACDRPKRFLAAPVAVGTIDQALLSMVQARHAHLRSVCLDRSLLVVDEVHASDRYMGRLLADLLHHHLSVGGSALLLSATLGSAARTSFVSSGADSSPLTVGEAGALPYPSVTLADGSLLRCAAGSPGRAVQVELLPLAAQPREVAPILAGAARAGARVLAVFNTVRRAVTVFREAEKLVPPEALFRVEGKACPHHGRFAAEDRALLDKAVSLRLGRRGPAGPAIVIGTQTLEQSLDIDADLLVTDLCPGDVLLQRIGRLHRHRRVRPPGFEQPRCIVLAPPVESLEELLDERGQPLPRWRREGYGSVYEDLRVMELTLRYLRDHPALELPRSNRDLVEFVTHPDQLAGLATPAWSAHGMLVEGQGLAETVAAHSASLFRLLERPFGDFSFADDFGGRVATRLGAPSWTLELPPGTIGPFGRPISEIAVPGHLLRDPPTGVGVHPAGPDELLLEVRAQGGETSALSFRYTRCGLEPAQGDAA